MLVTMAARCSVFLVALAASGCAPQAPPLDAGRDGGTEVGDAWIDPLAPPVVPVGLDAFDPNLWPTLRIGTRTIMRSTHDRSGGNDLADASHFLRADTLERFVTLDLEGPGALVFVRTNHWHGSPWHYGIDGADLVVSESSTATPDAPVVGSVFFPTALFPSPLAVTWSTTNGADLSWVPIPFARSFVLAYERTHYGTGYYIAQRFPEDAENLSRPIETWPRTPPPDEVLALLRDAGEIPPASDGARSHTGTTAVPASGAVTVLALDDGPARIELLRFVVPEASAIEFGRAHLRITWDDATLPSIDAPVALFFGAGTLYDRDGDEWLVRALPVSIRRRGGSAELATVFPMPFDRSARIELVGVGAPVSNVAWEVRAAPDARPRRHLGTLHATFVDHGVPTPGADLVLLDTTVHEGGREWCGSFVGTSFVFSENADLGTLEGDPRFYFDGARSPQAYGTGTEEWGGGGDYWGGLTMTLPLAGHPVGAPFGDVRSEEDAIESAYRFLLADLFPFGRSARIELEHGGLNESVEHYSSVVYWYGRAGGCLVATDRVDVGNVASETAHDYVSPAASPVEEVRSVWWAGPLVQPEVAEDGRFTRGASEMTFTITPDNHGALLRRTLDHAWADQRAEVYVADGGVAGAPFEHVGTWLFAGSTRDVRSAPGPELGAAEPFVEDFARRLAEDELLIASRYTRGRTSLRVRVVWAPGPAPWPRPVVPGAEPPPGAWSELGYELMAWVLPP